MNKLLCTFFGHTKGKKVSHYYGQSCSRCGTLWGYAKYKETFFYENRYEIKAGFYIVLLILLAILITWGSLYFIQKATCNTYTEMLSVNVQYNFWTGCMAEHPKFGWVPIQQYFNVINLNY